jgi:SP family sugar:H+ symporter-like MFS transporter
VWVLLGEMFNNRIRGAALALAAAAQWIANWLVTLTFPWLAREMGLGFRVRPLHGGRGAFVRARRALGERD